MGETGIRVTIFLSGFFIACLICSLSYHNETIEKYNEVRAALNIARNLYPELPEIISETCDLKVAFVIIAYELKRLQDKRICLEKERSHNEKE